MMKNQLLPLLVLAGLSAGRVAHAEPRNEVSYLRGPYNKGVNAFFARNNASFRYSAAFHYHHGKEHDLMQLTPYPQMGRVDHEFNVSVTDFVYGKKAKTEPTMELYGPYTDRFAHTLYRTIDWTHMHHEQTYDIMADKDISWADKKKWTDRAVRYYLDKNRSIARSIAPIDITMRRAAVMMKPYFTLYRNYSPESNSCAWVAHWWHPAAYEAMMIAGNDSEQEQSLGQMNKTMLNQVFAVRPERMILSRELMPRYSRMSPESANIFDNLHMLHGIAYDILAYKAWSPAQKRAELYRVIDAMGYKPGDEKYVRKFSEPYPDLDPRVYAPWMGAQEGEMSRIMVEMMMEMMPMMMPQMMPEGMSMEQMAAMKPEEIRAKMTPAQREMHDKLMAQFKMKNTQGIQPGELPGSLRDAMIAQMQSMGMEMKMMPGSTEPGKSSPMMANAMLRGWTAKYGNMPDIPSIDMSAEPTLPALPADFQKLLASWPTEDKSKPQYGQITLQAMPTLEQTTAMAVSQQLDAVNLSGNANRLDTAEKTGVTRPTLDVSALPQMMPMNGMGNMNMEGMKQ